MYSDPNSLRLSGGQMFAHDLHRSDGWPTMAAPATDAQQAAAVTIQRIFRGRRVVAELCRRHQKMEVFLRGHGGGRYLPSAGLQKPQLKRKRQASEQALLAHQMNAEQRLRCLKDRYQDLVRQVAVEVDDQHPKVLQRLGDSAASSKRLRDLRRQVADELFVSRLPDDACELAGFFSAQRPRLRLCHREFAAPAQDLHMKDSLSIDM